MVLVKLLELIGNHVRVYLHCVSCFLSDNQVVMYLIYCIRSALICTAGGDMGRGKRRNSNLSVAV